MHCEFQTISTVHCIIDTFMPVVVVVTLVFPSVSVLARLATDHPSENVSCQGPPVANILVTNVCFENLYLYFQMIYGKVVDLHAHELVYCICYFE